MNNNYKNCKIHETSVISPNAQLETGVEIGPYCIVGAKVKLGKNVKLHSHVVIDQVICEIGDDTEIYPFVSINKPQDLKFKNEASKVIIGKNNTLREYVTIQPGTAGDRMMTLVGNNCLLMAGVHIAHDCIVGDYVQMANNATLAGHVTICDYAIIGGLSAVHQFVTIGEHAIVGGMSGIEHDVIPYGHAKGERASLTGINIVGLKRRGFSRAEIDNLRSAYKAIFCDKVGTISERILKVSQQYDDRCVSILIDFITQKEQNSLLIPKK